MLSKSLQRKDIAVNRRSSIKEDTQLRDTLLNENYYAFKLGNKSDCLLTLIVNGSKWNKWKWNWGIWSNAWDWAQPFKQIHNGPLAHLRYK